MSDLFDSPGDPLAPFTSGQKDPKIHPVKQPAGPALADPFSSVKALSAQTQEAAQEGRLHDPFAEVKELTAQTNEAVEGLRSSLPWAGTLTPAQVISVNRKIADSPDPVGQAYRLGTAYQFARIAGISPDEAYNNIDALSMAYTSKPYEPKTTMRILGDAWNSAWMAYDMGNKAFQWALGGGTDTALEKELDALQAKINELDEDRVLRPWYIDALRSSAGSLPQMITGGIKGAGVAAGAGLLAAAVGVEVGTGGLGTPIAAGAAIGGMAMVGSAMDMYQTTQGMAYYAMRKQGHNHDVAQAMSTVSGFAQAATEGLVESIPGLGLLTGTGVDDLLTKIVAKRTAQSGLLNVAAVGLARYGTRMVGEGAEEFWQYLEDIGAQVVAQSIEDVGFKGPTAEEAVKQAGKQFVGGALAAGLLGFGDGAKAFKNDARQAAYIKAKAQSAMREGFDFRQFKSHMEAEYRLAEEQGFAPVLSEWDDETREKMTKALWDAGKKEAEAAKAKEAKAGLTLPEVENSGEESEGEVKRIDGRLYTQTRTVADVEGDGTIHAVFKLGDPTAKGKSKRLATIDYEVDGDTLTINSVSGKIKDDVKQEFILDLLEQHPGMDVVWKPKTEEDQALYDRMVEANPRGPEAGINWYSEGGTIETVRNRMHLTRKIQAEASRMGLTKEQVPAAVDYIDKSAAFFGLSTDDYLARAFTAENFVTGQAPAGALNQAFRGATEFKPAGDVTKALIYYAENADFSTYIHENTHALINFGIRNRAASEKVSARMAEIEKAFGVTNGNWNEEAAGDWQQKYYEAAKAQGHNLSKLEAVAYAMEDYLREGKAPKAELQPIFQRIAQWLYDVYQSIANRVNINPDIRRVFDELYAGTGPLSEVYREEAEQAPDGQVQKAARTTYDKNTRPDQKPKQPVNDLDEIYGLVEEMREHFTAWTEDLAEKHGVKIHARKTIKAKDRAARKITAEEGAEAILDIDGKTLIAPDLGTIDRIMRDLQGREEIVRIKDRFAKPAPGDYRDMLLNVKMPNGAIVELQITSEQLLEAKGTGHVFYEISDQVAAGVKDGRIDEVIGQKIADAAMDGMKKLYGPAYTATLEGAMFKASPADITDALSRISDGFQESGAGSSVLSEKTRNTLDALIASGLSSQSTKASSGSSIDGVSISASESSIAQPTEAIKEEELALFQEAAIEEQRDEKGRLLAPNGKPSALNDRQWKQVRTEAFKAWFGDWQADPANASKVVDENGEPRVVFHSGDFDTEAGDEIIIADKGVHFGTKAAAEERVVGRYIEQELENAEVWDEGGRWYVSEDQYPGAPSSGFSSRDAAVSYLSGEINQSISDNGIEYEAPITEVFLDIKNPLTTKDAGQEWDTQIKKAKKAGQDGIRYTNEFEAKGSESFMVFKPEQIKSAIVNSGTFDAENPSILYQTGREIDRVIYTFPPELKGYSDIHSQAQVSGVLNAFGRGVLGDDGTVRIGDVGTSHINLARGLPDAKRFYFGYSRDKRAVYVVAKNGMDGDAFKKPAVLQQILSQVFDKYKLAVTPGKRLAFQEKEEPRVLFQEASYIEKKAIEKYGIARDPQDAGYVFPSGALLELFKSQRGRALAHSTVAKELGFGTIEEMLKSTGAIRVDFNDGIIQRMTPLTRRQAQIIENNTLGYHGWINIGIEGPDGEYEQMGATVDEIMKETGSTTILFQPAPPIDSDAFHAWFKDSKVVDDQGKPMVVYHGSSFAFDVFKPHESTRDMLGPYSVTSPSFFFSESKEMAQVFAESAAERYHGRETTRAFYLSIKNPLDLRNIRESEYVEKMRDFGIVDKWGEIPVLSEAWTLLDDGKIVDIIKGKGYDGVLLNEGDAAYGAGITYDTRDAEDVEKAFSTWAVFSPEQIKSVNNRGTWDADDPRILYQPAYHGSPHRFDKFTTEKMGTGEGNQSFGWGLYFAGEKKVAEFYRESLSDTKYYSNERELHNDEAWAAQFIATTVPPNDAEQAKKDVYGALSQKTKAGIEKTGQLISIIDKLKDTKIEEKTGQLYRVEIPADEKYLDWDKKITEQPEIIDKIKATLIDRGFTESQANNQINNFTGQSVYAAIASFYGEKEASLLLLEHGIPGIIYLDANSRTKGQGSHNYVIFSYEDVSIAEVYYQHSIDDLKKSAKGYDSWEAFRDFWESGFVKDDDDAQTEGMAPEEVDEFYRTIYGIAKEEPEPEKPITTEEVNDEEAEAEFIADIKTDAGLRAYLMDLYGASFDKAFYRDIETAGPTDEEEARRYDAMRSAERMVEKTAAPTVYLGAKAVNNGTATKKILASARGAILNNPTEYRRLVATVQGDTETVARLKAKLDKPYILDPRWIATAEVLSIEKRKQLARTIRNEKIARKIVRGDIAVEDSEIEEHLKYLSEEAKKARKTIAEAEAKALDLEDRLGTTQRAALKQSRELSEYRDRLKIVEHRAAAYLERQAAVPAKTAKEADFLRKQIATTQAALEKAKTGAKTDAAELDALSSTLSARKERNRLQRLEAERRAVKAVRDEMKRLAAAATKPLGKKPGMPVEYQKKIKELQAGLDPQFRTKSTLAKLDHWRDWIARDPGATEIMPEELVKKVQAKQLNDWTLDELRQFKDRIDELKNAGHTIWKIRHNREAQERNHMADDFREAALAGEEFRPAVGAPKPSTAWTKIKLATLRPLAVFLELDGGKRGPFTKWLWDAVNEAEAEANLHKDRRKAAAEAKLKELGFTTDILDYKHVYIGKEMDIDGFVKDDGRKPTIQDVLYWQIGKQNEETYRALLAGSRYPESIIDKGISMLSKEALSLAEYIGQDFDENFPRVKEAFEYQYNMPLNAVDHYVPMRRLEATFDTRGEEVAVGLVSGTGQTKTFLNKGFTKSRIQEIQDDFQRPIRTDLVSLWMESIDKEEDFIAKDLLVKRLQDTLGRLPVQRAIQQRLGPEGVKWMKKYVNDIAQGNSNQAITGSQKFMQQLRGRMAVSYLSFNVLSNLKQLVSPLPYLADAGGNPITGGARLLSAAGQYLKGARRPGQKNALVQFVEERSDLIKHRSISRDFEDFKRIEASHNASENVRKAFAIEKKIGAAGMASLEVIDHVSVSIGWKAVYDHNISQGKSELEAIQAADDSTVLTQPSGRVQDLAEIYRSGETMKFFTMFTNALNAQWQMIAFRIPQAFRQKQYLHALGDAIALALCGLGIALASGAAYGDDDEEKRKRLVLGLFSQYTDSIPLVGSIATNAIAKAAGVQAYSSEGVNPFPWGPKVLSAVSAIQDRDVKKALAYAAEGTALGLGLPTSGPKRAIDALIDKDPALLVGWKKESDK
jgi:hypothetical protein